MSFSWPTRALVVGAVLFVLVAACKSSSSSNAGGSICSDAKSASTTCKDGTDCDATLATAACKTLGAAVSPSTLKATQDCLESGVCGVESCLSRAQKSSNAGDAHHQLALDYCTNCAPQNATCQDDFYVRGKKLPGVLLLPYADAIVAAVDQTCASTPSCAAKFTQCMNDTLTQAVGDATDPDSASCVVDAFKSPDQNTTSGPGGTVQIATCTADNCKGCCREDQCQPGNTTNACGISAQACQVCAGAQKCNATGACKEPCSPNNCRGCCDGDSCVDGTDSPTCGLGGAACKACSAGKSCSGHQCIDASCQATCASGCCAETGGCQPGTATNACGTAAAACIDCGAGRTCTNASCTLDPTSLWDFYVSFAVIPDTKADASSWDALGGEPDPYLLAYSNGPGGTPSHTGSTSTQTDTTIPFWAETPITGATASEFLTNLSFELWDSDEIVDDFIGGCPLPITSDMFDGSLQDITCPASPSGVSVELFFRINPHPSP